MSKEVVVISLGGSILIPDKINHEFLEHFKKIILNNTKKYKFVIVCGGGSTARNYIKGLEPAEINQKEFLQGQLGISITRMNARFMTYYFGKDANKGIPHDMNSVKNLLKINDVIFCGALRYAKDETSDATTAKLANYFKTGFINMTNVEGLYDKDPIKYKSAKFILQINYKEFLKKATKTKFKPGQHFVLDQTSAKLIKKYNIPTFIIGPDPQNLDNFLNDKHFVGTMISND